MENGQPKDRTCRTAHGAAQIGTCRSLAGDHRVNTETRSVPRDHADVVGVVEACNATSTWGDGRLLRWGSGGTICQRHDTLMEAESDDLLHEEVLHDKDLDDLSGLECRSPWSFSNQPGERSRERIGR